MNYNENNNVYGVNLRNKQGKMIINIFQNIIFIFLIYYDFSNFKRYLRVVGLNVR